MVEARPDPPGAEVTPDRPASPSPDSGSGTGPADAGRPLDAAVVVGPGPALDGAGPPTALVPILGRSPLQRHVVHLARLGVRRCVVLLEGGSETLAAECRAQVAAVATGEMEVVVVAGGDGAGDALPSGDGVGTVLRLRAEGVYDPRLYRRIAEEAGPAWLADDDGAGHEPGAGRLRPIGLAAVSPDALRRGEAPEPQGRAVPVGALPTYLPSLRRHLRPYWIVVSSDADRERAADRILDSAQKGILDFPARYLHAPVEDVCTRRLAATPVTPNQITVFTGVLGFTATWLFAIGSFGLALVLALITNVLDGVDGKLARVKLLASRFGDRLDHTLDVSFEFSWYLALGWGLAGGDVAAAPFLIGVALVAVMLGCRAISGVYKLITERQIHDHRAFDRAFRLVAGRRNIYVLGLVAGVLAGRVQAAFTLCLAWAGLTLVVYLVRTTLEGVARLAS